MKHIAKFLLVLGALQTPLHIVGDPLPDSPAEGFEFCLVHPAPGAFELWIRHGAVDQAGLAGFSANLSGPVQSFRFDPLIVRVAGPDGTNTTGFDVLGAGSTREGFNVYGVQTRRTPNRLLYDLGLLPLSVPGSEGTVEFSIPLRIGAGTYPGDTPPALEAFSAGANAFDPDRSGQSFAAFVATCCSSNSEDLDLDGLPDCWELQNFGNLDADPSRDSDGDGQSDADEARAGTDPNDPDSVLWITSIRQVEGVLELTFDTAPFHDYQVQYTSDLDPSASWTNLAPRVVGDGQPARVRDPDPRQASRFYRLTVRRP